MVVVAHDQSCGPTGELTGPFCGQDDQGKMVAYTLETIFDRNSRHGFTLRSSGRLPANGGLWAFRSRHGAEAAMAS